VHAIYRIALGTITGFRLYDVTNVAAVESLISFMYFLTFDPLKNTPIVI
jgi:hypothetical protein